MPPKISNCAVFRLYEISLNWFHVKTEGKEENCYIYSLCKENCTFYSIVHHFCICLFFCQIFTIFLQISFFSTSPELSNKQRFEYFSRTIPSDHYQTMAMAKIVERLGWKYMSIIYEESNYGIKASTQKKAPKFC